MPTRTRTVNTSSAGTGGRSTTPARRRSSETGEPVRVWSECSVTISVSSDPPQFIKFTHGFEKMAPNSSKAAISRTENDIFEQCERVVDRRVKRIARLIRDLQNEV